MPPSKRKMWLDRLMRRSSHCHWCGGKVQPSSGGRQEPNGATVDHIKSRGECQTKDEYRTPSNMVLSCYQCNQERNDAAQAKLLAVADLGVHLDAGLRS